MIDWQVYLRCDLHFRLTTDKSYMLWSLNWSNCQALCLIITFCFRDDKRDGASGEGSSASPQRSGSAPARDNSSPDLTFILENLKRTEQHLQGRFACIPFAVLLWIILFIIFRVNLVMFELFSLQHLTVFAPNHLLNCGRVSFCDLSLYCSVALSFCWFFSWFFQNFSDFHLKLLLVYIQYTYVNSLLLL